MTTIVGVLGYVSDSDGNLCHSNVKMYAGNHRLSHNHVRKDIYHRFDSYARYILIFYVANNKADRLPIKLRFLPSNISVRIFGLFIFQVNSVPAMLSFKQRLHLSKKI